MTWPAIGEPHKETGPAAAGTADRAKTQACLEHIELPDPSSGAHKVRQGDLNARSGATELRSYQRDLIARTEAAIEAGRRHVLRVAQTGSGKTVVAAAIIQEAVAAGKSCSCPCPSKGAASAGIRPEPMEPDDNTLAWIRSRQIAYARAKSIQASAS